MKNSGNVSFWTCIVFVVVGVLITLTEIPFMSENSSLYLVFRLSSIFPIIFYAFALRKTPTGFLIKLLLIISLCAYTTIGYLFRPMYLLGYTQIIFFFSFLFLTTRKEFYILSSIFYLGFVTVCYFNYESLPYNRGEESVVDIFLTPFVSNILALLVHHFFTAERTMKEALYERFNSIGKVTTTIVHDLKGSITTPLMVLGSLEESVNTNDIERSKENVLMLKNNLTNLGKVINGLNQLSNVTVPGNEFSQFNFNECLNEVKMILSKRLSYVDFASEGDINIKGNKELFTSIVLNIIANSLDEFREHNTSNPKISITASNGFISFIDNGPGFSADMIKKIKAGELNTTKQTGTGLGLYLVKESLKSYSAKLELISMISGGYVKIIFK